MSASATRSQAVRSDPSRITYFMTVLLGLRSGHAPQRESGAFLIMGTVLISVVARAVFSSGRVTHHRIIGAILVYLSAALTFVALYSIVGLLVPNAFSGMSFEDNSALASKVIYFSFVTLTSTGYGDVFRCTRWPAASAIWKRLSASSIPQPCWQGWYRWKSKAGADVGGGLLPTFLHLTSIKSKSARSTRV
jgi:Ion channel